MNPQIYSLGALLISSIAFAQGGQESHGGIGYVCGKDSAPTEVLMLDLVEAEEGPMKLTFKNAFQSPQAAIDQAIERLKSNTANSAFTKRFIPEVQKGMRFAKRDRVNLTSARARIPLNLKDSLPKIELEGCPMRQIADYVTNGSMSVVLRYENAFKPVHRAAFDLHEGIYKHVRQFKSMTSSLPVRQLVALLLADQRYDQEIMDSIDGLNSGIKNPEVKRKEIYTGAESREYVDYILEGRTLNCTTMNNKYGVTFFAKQRITGNWDIEAKLMNDNSIDLFTDQETLQILVDGNTVEFSEENETKYTIHFDRYRFVELQEERRRVMPKISNAKSIQLDQYGDTTTDELKCWAK